MQPSERQELQAELKEFVVNHLASVTGEPGPWDVTFRAPQRFLERFSSRTSEPQLEGGRAPWIGNHRVLVTFDSSWGEIRFPLYVQVSRPVSVVVARHAIARGTIITAADLDVRQVRQSAQVTGGRTPVQNIDDILGMEAVRSLRGGDVVTTAAIRARLLVKRGEVVVAVARGGGIAVRTEAKAKQDGARGDLIQVEKLQSKETFDAQVTGTREVTVFAGGSPDRYVPMTAAAERRRR